MGCQMRGLGFAQERILRMNLGKVKASLFREIHTWDLSLVAQWLRFRASNADGTILIPGWGTKIPHIVWYGQLKKKKEMPNP